MKKIIAFFVLIFTWFISLFTKKEIIAETYKEAVQEMTPSNPQTPAHNNRKVRKGRLVQYVNVGAGRKRAIYHSSK